MISIFSSVILASTLTCVKPCEPPVCQPPVIIQCEPVHYPILNFTKHVVGNTVIVAGKIAKGTIIVTGNVLRPVGRLLIGPRPCQRQYTPKCKCLDCRSLKPTFEKRKLHRSIHLTTHGNKSYNHGFDMLKGDYSMRHRRYPDRSPYHYRYVPRPGPRYYYPYPYPPYLYGPGVMPGFGYYDPNFGFYFRF